MKKIIFFIGILLVSTSFALPLEKITVILDWYPNPSHAPLMMAQAQGYFTEQGLDVSFVTPLNLGDTHQWVAEGKADIGLTYEPEFIEQVDKGMPLIRIGTLIDKPLNCLVTLKSSGIKTLADLKGKRIGFSTNNLSTLILKVMLAKEGLNTKDVKLVDIQHNLTKALISHKVDAVTGMTRNIEVPLMELNNQTANAFFPEEHGVPAYSELIFITNLSNAKDRRFPRFLLALKKAVKYLDKHPQQAWEHFAHQYPDENNAINREAWFATLPYFAEDPAHFNAEEWQRFAIFMQQNKLIKKTQPLNRYTLTLSRK